MASNIINDDDNNEVVSCQAMVTSLSSIQTGIFNLPPERQMEVIDTMQTTVNKWFMELRRQVSARAHQTASVAYPSHGSLQPQASNWDEINLHMAGSSGSGPISFSSMSSYSAASTISARSNSSRRRRPSSPPVTTTSSVSNASSTSVEEGSSITQFVQAICDAIKSLWHQAELDGDGKLCNTIFYFLKNIFKHLFGDSDNPRPPPFAAQLPMG